MKIKMNIEMDESKTKKILEIKKSDIDDTNIKEIEKLLTEKGDENDFSDVII